MQLATFDHEAFLRLVLHHFHELGRRNAVARNVDFAVLGTQQRDDRFLADFNREAVEVRHTRDPVIGVLLEHEALAERPFGQLECTGSDRLLAEVCAGFLNRFLRHDKREVERHDVQECCVRARQLEDDGARIGGRNARNRLCLALHDRVIAIDHGEEALARRLGGRIDHAVDRVDDIVGDERAAVVELDARTQLECVGQAVLGNLMALGEARTQIRRAGLVVHQAVEDRLDHRPVLPVIADRRIERCDVVLVGHDHVAAVLRLLCLGRGKGRQGH